MINAERKIILITGSTDGVGRRVAELLGSAGHTILVHGRDARRAVSVAKEIADAGAKAEIYLADFASLAEIRCFAAALSRDHPHIDVLINNAGIGFGRPGGDREESRDGHELRFAVNYLAPFLLTRQLLPVLRRCGGRIVNVASLSGKRVRNEWVGYSMTKFALMGLTHTTRHIAWEKGVRATAICPSIVRTDMTAAVTKVRREEMILVETMAELIRTIIELPNNAAIAELLVNCRLENML
jgi:NAD(P)-dependent dehydrogenase (short-subunit alcohol dehydrogenase family)